jgi:hypothetical protein
MAAPKYSLRPDGPNAENHQCKQERIWHKVCKVRLTRSQMLPGSFGVPFVGTQIYLTHLGEAPGGVGRAGASSPSFFLCLTPVTVL